MKKTTLLVLLLATIMNGVAQVMSYTDKLIKVGEQAPSFTLKTPQGKKVSLTDYQGKYVLLDFWASWCGDCRKASPTLVHLHDSLGSKVEFLGISFDDNKKTWTAAIEKEGLNWTHVSELKKWKETTISEQYGIKWIPTFYLIDPDGKVVFHALNEQELTQAFKTMETKQNNIQTVYKFLKEARVYYIATIDGDRPQCRPFGSLNIYDGELEIQTGHKKAVDRQIQKNPNVCIVALNGKEWMRIDATLKEETRIEAKEKMLNTMPELKNMYKADDDNTAVYMLTNVKAKNMATNKEYNW